MKLKSPIVKIATFSFFLFLAYQCVTGIAEEESKVNSDGTPKTERQLLIEKAFSAYDGSHRNLESYILSKMNDPDSYDHVQTNYHDKGDHLLLITKFRGKNAFGGTITNTVMAKANIEGNVTEITAWE
jgi:hypothetical protein